jgi:hypothetical protein
MDVDEFLQCDTHRFARASCYQRRVTWIFSTFAQRWGLLIHKYVPATGNMDNKERGQADVEYTAFLPDAEGAKTVEKKAERTLKASSVEISFDALDWKALPTLHHIVDRLKEIPVYEVVEAKIVEGTGVSDVSCMRRLD